MTCALAAPIGSPTNLQALTAEYTVAVERMERTWASLRASHAPHRHARLIARYVRSLRRCDRLRQELATLTAKGAL